LGGGIGNTTGGQWLDLSRSAVCTFHPIEGATIGPV
jgi:hypothetical protein